MALIKLTPVLRLVKFTTARILVTFNAQFLGAGTDVNVKVSAADTVTGTLDNKITPGAGLTRTIDNPSADEMYRLDVVANVDGSIVANPDDLQVGVLASDAQHGIRGGGTQHQVVIADGAAGFMSGNDKAKLDIMVNFVDGAVSTWISVTVVEIGAGMVQDDANAFTIVWASPLTADITLSGAGGLDTGSEAADTWYFVWVIDGPAVSPAALISISDTAPTMPGGYDRKRRVGVFRNDPSSDIREYVSSGVGRAKFYDYEVDRLTLLPLSAGTATVFTPVSVADFVPPTSDDMEWMAFTGATGLASEVNFRRTGNNSPTGQYLLQQRTSRFASGHLLIPGLCFEYKVIAPANLSVAVLGFHDQI